jgi:hypothetical protein
MSNDDLDWEDNPNKLPLMNHMIAGSFAGLAEHISIFPIDTLKTHLQCERCGESNPIQTWNCATRIVQREGIFRLWRGVSAMFAGCIPAHAAYFSLFEFMKEFLEIDKDGHHPMRAAICGATAALSHDIIMTPFDVIKQRMQLGYYKSMTHCFKSVIKTEGIGAFYIAFPTTVMMNIPFGMIMVAANESTKKVLNPTGKYDITSSMFAGSIAGGIAAFFTNPLDVVKTRLQTKNLQPCPRVVTTEFIVNNIMIDKVGSSNSNINVNNFGENVKGIDRINYRGTMQTIKHIFVEEGLFGFTRGIVPRILVHAPSVAISWTAYEAAKNILFSDKINSNHR